MEQPAEEYIAMRRAEKPLPDDVEPKFELWMTPQMATRHGEEVSAAVRAAFEPSET